MTKSHFIIKCSKRRSLLFTRFNIKHPQNNMRPFAIKKIKLRSKPYFVVKEKVNCINIEEILNLKEDISKEGREQYYG